MYFKQGGCTFEQTVLRYIPYTSAFEFLKQAPPAELIATGSFAQKMLRG